VRRILSLDALAVAVLASAAAAAAATFRDYGLGWDDYAHAQYGDLLLSLYRSGFADRRALSFVNLYMYGGGFDLLAALFGKRLPFDLFETRRLMGAAVGLVGLFVTWRLGRRLGGPLAGLIALLLLATCPLYYGHIFMNTKDAPFAVAMAIALLGIVRAIEEYPFPQPPTIALCGIGFGLALGSRVIGGFAVINAAASLALIVVLKSRQDGIRPALRDAADFLKPFIPGAILAYLVMGLVWPWSVVSPLNPFRAIEYFSNFFFFERPWRELFDGRFVLVTNMPRSYLPTLMALTLPEIMLALGLCGILGASIMIARGELGRRGALATRRAALLAVTLAAALPVLVAVATRPAMYNGIRHFVFLTPPLAGLGGLAAAWIAQRLRALGGLATVAGALFLIVSLTSPAIDMAQLHPYEYTGFNHIAGGVAGARSRYVLDYWGLSIRQASLKLHTLLERHGEKPRGEKWTVVVCGAHPAAVVASSPQFSAVWEPKDADFAITVGESYYCAKLDAPVLVEIKRKGVVYARVYDIRGRSISSLLIVHGPDAEPGD
jgi:hypothetical protein